MYCMNCILPYACINDADDDDDRGIYSWPAKSLLQSYRMLLALVCGVRCLLFNFLCLLYFVDLKYSACRDTIMVIIGLC